MLERPVRGWRLGLLTAMGALVALAVVVPFTREFLALQVPDAPEALVAAAIAATVWVLAGMVRHPYA